MSKLEEKLSQYANVFGKNYPLCVVDGRDTSEIIADIDTCLARNIEAPEPQYEDGIYY